MKANQQWQEHNSFPLKFQQFIETLYCRNEQIIDSIHHVLTSPITVFICFIITIKWFSGVQTHFVLCIWFICLRVVSCVSSVASCPFLKLPLSYYVTFIYYIRWSIYNASLIYGMTLWSNMIWFIVFNATFNNVSAIVWWSALLVEETGVPGENHRSVARHWQTLSLNVVSSTPRHERDSNSQL
jgi:hypothetical protein